jgi:hypothetical protein
MGLSMNSEAMAIILCLMGVISIFVFPKFTRWWYKQQFKGDSDSQNAGEYVEIEKKKYTMPMSLAIWGYRIGGIIFFAMAAFFYFTDILG